MKYSDYIRELSEAMHSNSRQRNRAEEIDAEEFLSHTSDWLDTTIDGEKPAIFLIFNGSDFPVSEISSEFGISLADFTALDSKTKKKIDDILKALEKEVNTETLEFVKKCQQKVLKASKEIQSLTAVKSKKFGL